MKKSAAVEEFEHFLSKSSGLEPLVGKWHLNYPVSAVASLTEGQASELLFGKAKGEDYETWICKQPRNLIVTIDYPLREEVEFMVTPECHEFEGKKDWYMNLGRFLRIVALKYKELYKAPKKNKIWGHCIEDLVFEAVIVKKDGTVEMGVGS